METIRRLVREAHRRSLWQVLGIYLVAGWAALEVVQTLTDSLGLPDWFPPFAVVLLIVGLPIVLATAFVQEGLGSADAPTPPGAAPAATDAGSPAPAGTGLTRLLSWRNALGGGVLAFALWGVIAAGWVLFGGGGRSAPAPSSAPQPVLAILPFENLAPDPSTEQWFADGIHDELISEVAKISGITVISRTSVLAYRGNRPDVREIGRQLGATAVLEATVRRAADRVRLTAQLIDAVHEGHLWTETYDRSSADVFGLQADLARAIATGLRAELRPEEAAALEAAATRSAEAYELYLRAKAALESSPLPPVQAHEQALGLLDRALGLDPDFARAHALQGDAHATLYTQSYDSSERRLAAAHAALERALQIDPNLLEAHITQVELVGWTTGTLASGVVELQNVVDAHPNSAEARATLALNLFLDHRLDDALREWTAALALAPRTPSVLNQAGFLHSQLGRREGTALLERSLEVDPSQIRGRLWLANGLLRTAGDTLGARVQVEEALRRGGPAVPTVGVQDDDVWPLLHVVPDRSGFLARVDTGAFLGDPLARPYHHITLAGHHVLEGDRPAARAAATRTLEAVGLGLAETRSYAGGQFVLHSVRSLAHAILGDADAALAEAAVAVDILARMAPGVPHPAAEIELEARALLGDAQGATAVLERYRGHADAPTPKWLNLFPYLLLAGDSAFVATLEGLGGR